jgi:hypothetical protein
MTQFFRIFPLLRFFYMAGLISIGQIVFSVSILGRIMTSIATLKNNGLSIEIAHIEGGSRQVFPIDRISSSLETNRDGFKTARLYFWADGKRLEIIASSNDPGSSEHGNNILGSSDPVVGSSNAGAAIGAVDGTVDNGNSGIFDPVSILLDGL